MDMKVLAGLACVAGWFSVSALDVALTPRGEVLAGGRIIRPQVYRTGWKGLSQVGSYVLEQDGRARFRLEADGRPLFDATAALDVMTNGRVRVTYAFRARETIRLQTLACFIEQETAVLEGRAWRMRDEKGERAGRFRPAVPGPTLLRARPQVFSCPLGDTGRTLTFHPVAGRDVVIQDNRRWSQTYSVRVGHLDARTYGAGDEARIVFELTADEPLVVKSYKPVEIARGADWIALDYRKNILAGSALDFSHMGFTDAPAGKHGWLRNDGGHFVFERLPGRPQRFYGVNLCGTANFPTHDVAEELVARLKRLGYNTIRLHHHDGGTVKGSPDALTLNAEMMDRMDYLVATAIREGLYITTDLFVSRTHAPITWRQIGVDQDGNVDIQLFKALCAVHEPAFENWAAYARNFLLHVNPYTGRRYLDEPAMPFICLINEGGLFMGWGRENRTDPRVRAAWRKWVLAQRAQDPAFDPDADPDQMPNRSDSVSFARFMGELETRMVTRMTAFLRSLGCKALLTNNNCGNHPVPLLQAKAAYDYVDDHFYVDHPHFLEKKWRLPSRCQNENPVLTPRLVPGRKAFTRLADKPFTVTEWNFSGPGMFRGVGGILTGAMAALQDWDGLWRFAYAHSRELLVDQTARGPGYFDLGSDPLGQASDRASICLFLRGDLAPLPAAQGMALQATDAAARPVDSARAFGAAPSWSDAAWRRRMASCLTPESAGPMNVVPRERAEEAAVTNQVWCAPENPALTFDRRKGSFRLDTPRTCGGFTPEGILTAGILTATVQGAAATVWVSALDEKPLAQSRRILATHLTDVQGEGARFATPEMKVVLKWGRCPLVRNGQAAFSLKLERPESYTVYELETTGRRLGTVPSAVKNGSLVFTATVAGPHGARMLYEIVAE